MTTPDQKDILINVLINHIQLLGEDLNSALGMAYVHGWRSPNVENGQESRRRILNAYRSVYGVNPSWLYTKDLGDNPPPPSF